MVIFNKQELLELIRNSLMNFNDEELSYLLKSLLKVNKPDLTSLLSFLLTTTDKTTTDKTTVNKFDKIKQALKERIKARKYYNFNRQSIEDYFNISGSLACKIIKSLVQEGLIEKAGSGKNCSYRKI